MTRFGQFDSYGSDFEHLIGIRPAFEKPTGKYHKEVASSQMGIGSHHMAKVEFKKTVETDNEARLNLLDEVVEFCRKAGINPVLDEYEFYLILDEAVTNSMEHGNRWDAGKSIEVSLFPEDDNLIIRIRDEGIGFNPDFVVQSFSEKQKALSPRGRGIFIIRKFCSVSWNAIGNEITLKVGLKK